MAAQLNSVWHWLAAGLVFLIPGCSLLIWLPARRAVRRDILAVFADGAALSISIMVLLALWLSLAGIRVETTGVVGFYAAGLVMLGIGLVRRWGARLRLGQAAGWGWMIVPAAALLIGVGVWRFYQAKELALPAWVDSVHHVLVVRLMLESGGLPVDLMPYIPAPFFYHYGFHLMASLFALLTQQTPEQAVFWFGQLMNAAVAFSVYRAALIVREEHNSQPDSGSRFWQAAPALAATAAVLVGFAFQMPAYYVTWGRYTLLAGLVLVGPALAAAWEVLQDRRNLGAGIKLALLVAGLCMTHYFALLLYALFLVILGIFGLGQSFRRPEKGLQLLYLAGWAGLGLLAAAPWVWRVWLETHNIAQMRVINPIGQTDEAWQGALDYLKYLIYLIGPRHNHILMGLSGIGLLFGLRRPALRPIALWGGLLALLCLPWGPRFGPFRPDLYAIILFFPASILLANLLVSGVEALSRIAQPGGLETPWLSPVVLVILVGVTAGWGARETRNVLNDSTILAEHSDRMALDWVEKNTPPDARFYINSVLWQGQTYRGVDGGYWLMPYTGRTTSLPPVLYSYGTPEYYNQIKSWAARSGELTGCEPQFWEIIQEAQLTHIYVKQGIGSLQPEVLSQCTGLHPVYQRDGVFIYQIDVSN